MSTQISALCESLVAFGATERSESRMLSKMVSQVAALLECGIASLVLALKVEFDSVGVRILHLDRLVPFIGNSFKCLRIYVLLVLLDPIRIQIIKITGHI